MVSSPLPEILIAHPWMGRGGSEAAAMWSIHALQHVAKVTFTSASPVDWDALNAVYGTRVSTDLVDVLPAPRLPGVKTGTRLAHWQRSYFERFCLKNGAGFDVCISAYNPLYFGRPAIQLIGDFSFSEESRLLLYPNAADRMSHRPSLVRGLYITAGDCLSGGKPPPWFSRGDVVVANSGWTARELKSRFSIDKAPVLYPPSPLCEADPDSDRQRDPLGLVCLGRIEPAKELEIIIDILDRVRAAGYPVTLDLVGGFDNSAYARRIRRMVDERAEWIRTPGFMGPAEKGNLFATRSFAIHGSRVEAFGIAVAEMAAAGLVPIVPRAGGVQEIAVHEELIYRDPEDGARKIIALIQQPEKAECLRNLAREHVTEFRPEKFAEGLVKIVESFLGRPLARELEAV